MQKNFFKKGDSDYRQFFQRREGEKWGGNWRKKTGKDYFKMKKSQYVSTLVEKVL